jgi:hypothetical protein
LWRFEHNDVRRVDRLLGFHPPGRMRGLLRRVTPVSHRSPA